MVVIVVVVPGTGPVAVVIVRVPVMHACRGHAMGLVLVVVSIGWKYE